MSQRLRRRLGVAGALLIAAHARAQAPASGPLLPLVPASTRAAALGNAWVAGRDEDVIFYNPAQMIGATRGGFNVTYAHFGTHTTYGSVASTYAAGPSSLTLGLGVQFVDYGTRPEVPYPYTPALLTEDASVDAYSVMITSGLAVVFKGFRVGATAKFASDRIAEPSTTASGPMDVRHDAFLGDVGIARSLFGGTAGLSAQNLGNGTTDGGLKIKAPRQFSAGWSSTRQAGPFDLGLYAQVTGREKWVSPGGGAELAYSWIEGYSFALRAGGRRTDSGEEKPMSFGASFTGDHLTLDYAIQMFDGNRNAHRVTFRWR